MIGSNSVLNSVVVVGLERSVDYIRTVYSIYYDSLPEKIRKVGDIDMFHFCAKNIPPDQKDRYMSILSGVADDEEPKKLLLFYKNGVKFIELSDIISCYVINYELHEDNNKYILKSKFITQDECILYADSSREYNNILKSRLKYVVVNNEKIEYEKIVRLCKALSFLDEDTLHNHDRMVILNDLFKYYDYSFEEAISLAGGEEIVDSVKSKEIPVAPIAKGIIYSSVSIYNIEKWGKSKYMSCDIYIVNNEDTKCAIIFPIMIPSDNLRQIVLYDFNTGKVRFYFTRYDTKFNIYCALYDGKTNVIVEVKTLSGKIVCRNMVNKKLNLSELDIKDDDLLRITFIGCEENWTYIIRNHRMKYQEYSRVIIPSYLRIITSYTLPTSGVLDCCGIIANNHCVTHYGGHYKPTANIIYKYILSHNPTF